MKDFFIQIGLLHLTWVPVSKFLKKSRKPLLSGILGKILPLPYIGEKQIHIGALIAAFVMRCVLSSNPNSSHYTAPCIRLKNTAQLEC